MLRIAIDIGGTFTDVVAQSPLGFDSVKVLTDSRSPESGAIDGLDRLLGKLAKNYTDITGVVHGTTLATNALIERRGAKTAFITTAGFRDVLEMRYEKRFEQYALNLQMPEPLVPRPLRIGLAERILADGTVLTRPTASDIAALAQTIKLQKVESVAIGFMHAYKYPMHERLVADQLSEQLDSSVTICQSAEVAGEIREYERFSTVCANAYVRPLMARYLDKLLKRLQLNGFNGSFLMMLADGGLTTLDKAMRFPIRLVEGGPAGGVALGAHVAREVGSDKTLALDIGGTTAKICFIENGEPKTTRRFEIARAWHGIKGSGLPVKVPAVELVEIGAGGGSIASIDTLGRLNVGPLSASSEPGPASYGLGGEYATITDAHLTVGNLAADGFAGGIIDLKPELALTAISKHVQQPLGFDKVESAAAGVIELADETMANAARVHGIELGLDISSFDLLVSGGGGGLHAARIAEKLGMNNIIVPGNAGVGSAVGFLHSPVAFEAAISVVENIADIGSEYEQLVDDALAHVQGIVGEAVPAEHITTSVKAELRYRGQGMEQTFVLNQSIEFTNVLSDLELAFKDKYKERFGFTLDNVPIELVTFTVSAKENRQTTQGAPVNVSKQSACTSDCRKIYDVVADDNIHYDIHPRSSINGSAIQGPVVVPEAQTTTLVRPGWSVQNSPHGHLLLRRSVA